MASVLIGVTVIIVLCGVWAATRRPPPVFGTCDVCQAIVLHNRLVRVGKHMVCPACHLSILYMDIARQYVDDATLDEELGKRLFAVRLFAGDK